MKPVSVMVMTASLVAMSLAMVAPSWAQQGPPPLPPGAAAPSQATPGAPPPPGGAGGPPPPPAGGGGLPPLPPGAGPGGPPGPRLTLDDIVYPDLPPSEGRGAAFPPISDKLVGADLKGTAGGAGPPPPGAAVVGAENGNVPAGITPLERDIFTSDDFYKDRDLWNDPRYYRCNSLWGIESTWGSYEAPSTGDNPPDTIAWGYCDRDYPREDMVSPYAFKTAQEHFEALKAEAATRGGPTKYTRENQPPDWSGSYSASFGLSIKVRSWIQGALNQIPTYLSLLTPEYQQRMVQQMWHDAHNEVIWPAAFCWPEGWTRRLHGPSGGMFVVTPNLVEISGGPSEKLVNDVYINREFKLDGGVPYLSADVRQYNGESVGFWDGDVLVVWTSNVKHHLTHGWFETSDQFQAIEQFWPLNDKEGKFIGLMHEVVMYDPEALVEPIRMVERLQRQSGLEDGRPRTWARCIQNLFPVDGKQTATSPGDVVQITVPDMSGRPWADVWAASETNMERPKEADVLSDFQ